MRIAVVGTEDWRRLAVNEPLPCPFQPIKVHVEKGAKIVRITPWMGWCHGVRVLGGDWVPVIQDGLALLEQMVHSPSIFLPKSRHLHGTADGIALASLPERVLSEDVVLVGGSPNYYHWLVDNLPRLLMARGFAGHAKLLVPDNLLEFQRRTLELLGYSAQHLIPVSADECVVPNRMLVPSLLATSTFPHPDVVKLLRKYLLSVQHPPKASRRIFISRADAKSRRLLNEDELMPVLERHGFERVVIGQMSFDEQIRLYAEVDVLLAVHGAGITNMVFMPPQSKVLEIGCRQHPATFFSHLALVSGRSHQVLHGDAVMGAMDDNALAADWVLHPDVLTKALAQLG